MLIFFFSNQLNQNQCHWLSWFRKSIESTFLEKWKSNQNQNQVDFEKDIDLINQQNQLDIDCWFFGINWFESMQ